MTDMTQVNQGQSSGTASVQEAAAGVARQAGGEAKAVTQDVRAHGQQLLSTSVDELRNQASSQTSRLAGGLQDATKQLRGLASGDAQPGMVKDVVQQLADVTQRTADRLNDGGLDGALDELRRVARNRTGLFLLGALGAGVLAGRVLRASDTRSLADSAKEAFTGGSDAGPSSGATPGTLSPSTSPSLRPTQGVGMSTGVGTTPGGTYQGSGL